MPAKHDPYELTQVPSPLIQPAGKQRIIGNSKTVVIGEQTDVALPSSRKIGDGRLSVAIGRQKSGSSRLSQKKSADTEGSAPSTAKKNTSGALTRKRCKKSKVNTNDIRLDEAQALLEQLPNKRHGCIKKLVFLFAIIVLAGLLVTCTGMLDDDSDSGFVYQSQDFLDAMDDDSDGHVDEDSTNNLDYTLYGYDGTSYYYDLENEIYYTDEGRVYVWDDDAHDWVEQESGETLEEALYGSESSI